VSGAFGRALRSQLRDGVLEHLRLAQELAAERDQPVDRLVAEGQTLASPLHVSFFRENVNRNRYEAFERWARDRTPL
jgi:hypothetical protein